jgi:hypothetical protein
MISLLALGVALLLVHRRPTRPDGGGGTCVCGWRLGRAARVCRRLQSDGAAGGGWLKCGSRCTCG